MEPDERNGTGRLGVGVEPEPEENLGELLSDPHVRHLLEYLRRADAPVDLSTLATHVAAGVTDDSPEAVSEDVRDRVQTFLHHGHLPELDSHDVVEFDREAETVSLAT